MSEPTPHSHKVRAFGPGTFWPDVNAVIELPCADPKCDPTAKDRELAETRAKAESAGALVEEIVRRFGQSADVRKGVAAWHLYASELKPWLDDNRPEWRARAALKERP